jgi:hypothetical protein
MNDGIILLLIEIFRWSSRQCEIKENKIRNKKNYITKRNVVKMKSKNNSTLSEHFLNLITKS